MVINGVSRKGLESLLYDLLNFHGTKAIFPAALSADIVPNSDKDAIDRGREISRNKKTNL